MSRSKAYLYGGVKIRWTCAPELLRASRGYRKRRRSISPTASRTISAHEPEGATLVHPDIFTGSSGKTGKHGGAEWAVAWTADADGFLTSYCNTIPTPDGGTHESGLRSALTRGLKDHAERIGQGKRAAAITSDDVMTGAGAMLSVFIREPEFQGQTKDRLATAEASASSSRRSRTRSTIGSPAIRCRRTSCSTSSRARRRTHPPPAGEGNLAQERGAQAAAAGQAIRLHQFGRARLGDFHRRGRQRRRLRQAGTRPQPRRPYCRYAARSSTSPPPAKTSWRRTRSLPISFRRSAVARRTLPERPALREGHRHDRRRR